MKTFLAAALLLPALATAQDPTPLDPLVVTATRTEQALSQTLASTLVITREEIERAQTGDLAELLRFYAGFDVDRAGGPGALAQVRVRGGETDHVLLLVDGVRFNPASNGPTLQTLSPDSIERIEIVKGPRSTLYGSEGISATINVITRSTAARGEASARLGSYATREASAGIGGDDGRTGYSLQVGHLHSDGLPTCTDTTLDRGVEQTTVAAKTSVRAGPVSLTANALDNQGSSDYMNFGCPGGFIAASQDFQTQALSVVAAAQPASNWTTTLTASRTLDDLQQREAPDYSRTTRPGVDWHNVIAVGDANRVSTGIDYAHERGEALFTGFGTTLVQEARDISALYAQDEFASGRHHALAAARLAHDSAFGTQTTWNAEYGIDVIESLRLIATAGTGYRAPTFLERSPGFFGNPDLQPEESRSYELGARQTFSLGHTLDLRAFRTDTTNLITGFPPQNIASARSQGLELTWRARVRDWSSLLTAIAQNPEDRQTGQLLPRRAKRSVALKLDRAIGKHHVGVDVLGTGHRRDTDFLSFPAQDVTLGGYTLVNLHGSLQLDPHTTLQLTGENVLGKDYVTAFGYRQPGAAAYVGLRYSW
jgi:vitamin B12 transporter